MCRKWWKNNLPLLTPTWNHTELSHCPVPSSIFFFPKKHRSRIFILNIYNQIPKVRKKYILELHSLFFHSNWILLSGSSPCGWYLHPSSYTSQKPLKLKWLILYHFLCHKTQFQSITQSVDLAQIHSLTWSLWSPSHYKSQCSLVTPA